MDRHSNLLRSKDLAEDCLRELGGPIGSSSRLDLSVGSELDTVGADVNRMHQEIADSIDTIYNGEARFNAGIAANRRAGLGYSMGFFGEGNLTPLP